MLYRSNAVMKNRSLPFDNGFYFAYLKKIVSFAGNI